MSRFDSIPLNGFFRAEGMTYRKISPQVYADPYTGIETYWDPLFDGKIEAMKEAGEPGGPKFSVDPSTRVVTANPQHYSAEQAMRDLHESGYFECEASDYRAIVQECLRWGKGRKRAKKA